MNRLRTFVDEDSVVERRDRAVRLLFGVSEGGNGATVVVQGCLRWMLRNSELLD